MRLIIIFASIILFFGAFSTIFHDTKLVGNLGKIMGDTNIFLFGYLAYVNLILIFYPLYRFYKNPELLKRLDGYTGWILFYISMVLLQSLIIDGVYTGYVGREISSALIPFIGKAGMWLLWMMSLLMSLVLLVDDDYNYLELLEKIKSLKNRGDKEEDEVEYEDDGKIHSLKSIYTTFRTITSNPFNFKKKDDIDEILNMKLEPIDGQNLDRFQEPTTPKPQLKATTPKATIKKEPRAPKAEKPVATPKKASPKPSTTEPKEPKTANKTTKKGGVEIVNELEENSKILAQIDKGATTKPKNFRLPKIDFLTKPPKVTKKVNEAEIDRKIGELLSKLQQFKIEGDVIRTYTGPVVTTFEFKPAPNVKVSKILGLQDDLAMALSAETIRIQAPIPGRDVVGIEIPNESFETIYLREILESKLFKESSSPLTVALGKDIVGNPFITDIKKLPHILIAGTTGSGKSVGINAMILSLLYRNDPDQLKLMLIDPKMLEFSIYNDIPHLITPVIIEPKKAIAALANMVGEMERRYKLMADNRTKNIDNYNQKVKANKTAEPFPFIVIVIDELADLMMNGGKDVEYSIARLAQMARACGIHLIVATQRPSVDVVTGLIKANLPSRLSYRVGQRIDSKVILDTPGAESLLGRGDGLFTPPGATGLVRLHAPWNSEDEVERVVEFLKEQRLPVYDESYLVDEDKSGLSATKDIGEIKLDPLYEQAKEVIITDQKTSISYLQRKLQIGYNRSANIIDQLQKKGILSEPNAKGNREIL